MECAIQSRSFAQCACADWKASDGGQEPAGFSTILVSGSVHNLPAFTASRRVDRALEFASLVLARSQTNHLNVSYEYTVWPQTR
jgi:hypothetical protein